MANVRSSGVDALRRTRTMKSGQRSKGNSAEEGSGRTVPAVVHYLQRLSCSSTIGGTDGGMLSQNHSARPARLRSVQLLPAPVRRWKQTWKHGNFASRRCAGGVGSLDHANAVGRSTPNAKPLRRGTAPRERPRWHAKSIGRELLHVNDFTDSLCTSILSCRSSPPGTEFFYSIQARSDCQSHVCLGMFS